MIPSYAPYDPQAPNQAVLAQAAVVSVTSDADKSPRLQNSERANLAGRVKPLTGEKKKSVGGSALNFRPVSRATVLLTLNQLTVMSKNGIDITEALETVATHCPDKRLAASLRQIHDAVNGGRSFSSAVAANCEHFPSTLPPMLTAAEATGRVPQTLGKVCDRLRGEMQMRGTILGAMIYPLILIFASFVVMSALVLGVLPQFSKVFLSLGRPVPGSTQFLLNLGDFCCAHCYWMLPAGIGAVTSLVMLRQHPFIQRPLNRFLMFGWPIRSGYRPLLAGRTFRTLAAMVGGGVPLLQAVRLTRNTTRDIYWRDLLDRIENNLIDGSSASAAMSGIQFIPSEASQMMATAERTGRVAEVLDSIGEFYEEEASRRIKRLVIALEPAIILVMGVFVAAIVMSLLLPLLDVSSVR